MNNKDFKNLHIDKKIEYFNRELSKGSTVIRIIEDIGISEKKWQHEVKENGYRYNTKTKKYELIKELVPKKEVGDKETTIVVKGISTPSQNINHELVIKELEDIKSMYSKFEEMYEWYELQRKVVEKEHLRIEANDSEVVTRSFKIYGDVYKEFMLLCKEHKEYKVQDLVSKALEEFCIKYK